MRSMNSTVDCIYDVPYRALQDVPQIKKKKKKGKSMP